jgi:iron(III) transport system ATP-binding protein
VNKEEKISQKSIVLKNLTKIYKGISGEKEVIAVDDISLKVEPGELLTLLGPSGCGKTTALRMIAGLEIPTSGEIYLENKMINNLPANKRDTAMVFQSYGLFPHMTIAENIAYGWRYRKIKKAEIKKKVNDIIKLIGLEGLGNRAPGNLSGGQQQRVALARALVIEPSVLLCDEPLSNLDAKLRILMRSEIRRLQRCLSITTIYVTHDQTEAMSLSDRIVIMNKGKIEQVGTPFEIYNYPRTKFVAGFIGSINFIESKVEKVSDSIVTVNIFNTEFDILYKEAKIELGAEVLVITRPETIKICPKAEAHLSGVITRVTYLGPIVEYDIDIEEGLRITVVDYNPRRKKIHREGEKIGIKLSPEHLYLLPKTSG